MSINAGLAELLACPACGTRLTGASCLACRIDFPSIAGIPWLMPEPRLALTEWRGRLHHLLTHYAAEAARQRSALDGLDQASPARRTHRARGRRARRPGTADARAHAADWHRSPRRGACRACRTRHGAAGQPGPLHLLPEPPSRLVLGRSGKSREPRSGDGMPAKGHAHHSACSCSAPARAGSPTTCTRR